MKIKRFEEIEAWQKSRELTRRIYKISAQQKFSRDWELKNQIRSASLSVMSDIAEGFDSFSRAEFARFLNISRRSSSEIQSQLYAALDQGYIEQEEFKDLYERVEQVRKMITGFIKYLKDYNSNTR
jgi:four helix bundle protein